MQLIDDDGNGITFYKASFILDRFVLSPIDLPAILIISNKLKGSYLLRGHMLHKTVRVFNKKNFSTFNSNNLLFWILWRNWDRSWIILLQQCTGQVVTAPRLKVLFVVPQRAKVIKKLSCCIWQHLAMKSHWNVTSSWHGVSCVTRSPSSRTNLFEEAH